jgi:hypothetical protein
MKTMSYNIDNNPYIDYEFDDNFLNWYELEVISKISEHSRQIRSLLNYKNATIRYFYSTTSNTSKKALNSKFFENKRDFELNGLQLIKNINNIKDLTGVLEEGIQIMQNNALSNNKNTRAYLIELKKIINSLFIKIHFFSEQDIHQFPRFLMIILRIANETCKVQKCLNREFSEFYQELEENYFNLEKELTVMISRENAKLVMKDNKRYKLRTEELLQ